MEGPDHASPPDDSSSYYEIHENYSDIDIDIDVTTSEEDITVQRDCEILFYLRGMLSETNDDKVLPPYKTLPEITCALGEWVRSENTGKKGIIINIKTVVSLIQRDATVIQRVDALELKSCGDIAIGDFVFAGQHIGRIVDCYDSITIQISDMSEYQLNTTKDILDAVRPKHAGLLVPIRNFLYLFPYAVGQKVRLRSRFLHKFNLPEATEGTITNIIPNLTVDWLINGGEDEELPSVNQKLKDVNLCPQAAKDWVCGDFCLYDANVDIDEPPSKKPRVEEETVGSLRGRCSLVFDTNKTFDVLWQDGTVGICLLEEDLIIAEDLQDYEFRCYEYVRRTSEVSCTGVVQMINMEDKQATVIWLNNEKDAHTLKGEKEVISMYELERHPDFTFSYGDAVVRVGVAENSTENWFGCVVGFGECGMQVKWQDGLISTVHPQVIAKSMKYRTLQYEDEDEDEEYADEYAGASADASSVGESIVISDQTQCLRKEPGSMDTFAIVEKAPSDHLFSDVQKNLAIAGAWVKKVSEEWENLPTLLPPGIHVEAYEDRMDLMRAVIAGPYGTPYQDGLFFFDLYLPPSYPQVPPKVLYDWRKWAINPNLHQKFTCLSLLDTTLAEKTEMWMPEQSNVRQVLISLQALVLVRKPYFNEAKHESLRGTPYGDRQSIAYNEQTFLNNCEIMIDLIDRPPLGFESFVHGHFKDRGPYILKACIAYLEGNLVGSLLEDSTVDSNIPQEENSVGFKEKLVKILPKLIAALEKAGADCSDFKDRNARN